MDMMRKQVEDTFGHRLRVRVSGLLVIDDRLLLVSHKGLGPEGIFWSPPGGGMEYGSSAEENLHREFEEETHIRVKKSQFLFVHEFLKKPLHAIELFFQIDEWEGALKLGSDPEMVENQILTELNFFTWKEIKSMPVGSVHQAIYQQESLKDLLECKSYFKF